MSAFDAGMSEARKHGWNTHEVPGGHDVMIDAPTQLAENTWAAGVVTPGTRANAGSGSHESIYGCRSMVH
jgi:hypothetical protein